MTKWTKINQYAYIRTVNNPCLYSKTFYKKTRWLEKHGKDYWSNWHNEKDHHKIINEPIWIEEKKPSYKHEERQLTLEF